MNVHYRTHRTLHKLNIELLEHLVRRVGMSFIVYHNHYANVLLLLFRLLLYLFLNFCICICIRLLFGPFCE